ncbi:MAG: DR2241 family protein [Verrucomicrobiales bacterium]
MSAEPGAITRGGESLTHELASWLDAGGSNIGQVFLSRLPGRYELRHIDDRDAPGLTLETFIQPTDAREIARFDSQGSFRPLKSAPNLRRGWRIEVPAVSDVRQALDFFYPAAVGNWARFSNGEAQPVPLRETLNRQTGIYRITALMTDEQAAHVICSTCEPSRGCLRRITWTLDGVRKVPGLPAGKFCVEATAQELPVLCLEACNWFISQARSHLRNKQADAAPAPPAKW